MFDCCNFSKSIEKIRFNNIFTKQWMGWNVTTIKTTTLNLFTGQLQIVQCIASPEVWPQTRRLQNNVPPPQDNSELEVVTAENDWTMSFRTVFDI